MYLKKAEKETLLELEQALLDYYHEVNKEEDDNISADMLTGILVHELL